MKSIKAPAAAAQFDLARFRALTLPKEQEITASWQTDVATSVSILCPTFNHRPYIEDALRGFLLQRTTFPFEIVLHDDASTDGTSAVVREYAERYPTLIRAKVQEQNQYSTGGDVLQLAASLASGEIFALCDGDDFWIDPYKLQMQFDQFMADPEVTLVHTDLLQLSPDGIVGAFHPLDRDPPCSQSEVLQMQLSTNVVITLTVAYKASIFREFHLSNIMRSHWTFGDYALSLYALLHGRAVFLARKTAIYRHVAGSATHRGRNAMTVMAGGMHECRMHYLGVSGLPDSVREKIAKRSMLGMLRLAALRPDVEIYERFDQALRENGVRMSVLSRLNYALMLRVRPYLLIIRALRILYYKTIERGIPYDLFRGLRRSN